MKYGTIGTSWITEAYIRGARLTEKWDLAAVYSRDEAKGRAFAARFGAPPVYTDLVRMAQSDIEAVYIASPNSLHEEHSRLFLEHGKHVLCEKPIAVTSAGLQRLQDLAGKNGLVYMEAIMLLHIPGRDVLRRAMGEIGRITSARLDFSQLSSQYVRLMEGGVPNVFNPRMAGGCLMDLGIYCVYAALDLFGKPEGIRTAASFLPTGADGSGGSLWTYPGTQVSLSYSKTGQSRLGSEILGDRGTVVLESVSKLTGIRMVHNQRGESPEELLLGDVPKDELMRGEAADFARAILRREETREELDHWSKLAFEVCQTLEDMRGQAGIRLE